MSMTIEELEARGTTVSEPLLQQTLDLVRKYNQRFYVTEEVRTEQVPVVKTRWAVLHKTHYEERTNTLYTIWRVSKNGVAFPIRHRRPDGTEPTAVPLESAIDWFGGWIFNEGPRHKSPL